VLRVARVVMYTRLEVKCWLAGKRFLAKPLRAAPLVLFAAAIPDVHEESSLLAVELMRAAFQHCL